MNSISPGAAALSQWKQSAHLPDRSTQPSAHPLPSVTNAAPTQCRLLASQSLLLWGTTGGVFSGQEPCYPQQLLKPTPGFQEAQPAPDLERPQPGSLTQPQGGPGSSFATTSPPTFHTDLVLLTPVSRNGGTGASEPSFQASSPNPALGDSSLRTLPTFLNPGWGSDLSPSTLKLGIGARTSFLSHLNQTQRSVSQTSICKPGSLVKIQNPSPRYRDSVDGVQASMFIKLFGRVPLLQGHKDIFSPRD